MWQISIKNIRPLRLKLILLLFMTNVASISCLLRLNLGFIVSGYHCVAPGDTPYNGLYGSLGLGLS